MAEINAVPSSVSMPIPGFDEARAAWAEQYAREEERRRVVEGDRWAYRRSQLNDQSAQVRLMADLNPLKVAGEMYAGEMAAAGLGAVGRAVFSTRMRPGYIRFPTAPGEKATFAPVSRDVPGADMLNRMYAGAFDVSRVQVSVPGGTSSGAGGVSLNQTLSDALRPTRVMIEDTVDRTVARTGETLYFGMTGEETSFLNPGRIVRHPASAWNSQVKARILSKEMPTMPAEGTYVGRFPQMNTPTGEGPARVVRAYETYAQTMRNLYKSPEAHKALADAAKTGDRTSPLVQLYDEAREGMAKARATLSEYQGRVKAKADRDTLASALSGVRTDAELAKSLRATPVKGPRITAKAGELFPNVVLPWLKDRATHPFSTAWSAFTYPFKHPFKVAIPTAVAGYAGTAAVRATRDSGLSAGTAEVADHRKELDAAYAKFTGDEALKSAMSDKNALRAGLLGMREQAVREYQWDQARGPAIVTRVNDYINSVKDSPAFAELVSDAESGYAARALRPDDYQREFRETYRDPASQAIGDDFWREIGGAP